MTFFESLINSLSLVPSLDSRRRNPNSIDQSMEGGLGGDAAAVFAATANERVAYKLKGYFDLAKEEIDKAVRAEELGTIAEAIVHYRNALRILVEGSSTPSFSYISPSEQQKVKSYRQKISKWQGQVSERLGVLCQQSAGIANKVQRTNVGESTAPSSSRKDTHRRSQQSGVSTPVGHDVVGIKPGNKAGPDYDDKLVEMINTAIVDRSPSIKWDDVAGLDKAKQALMEMVILPTKRKDLFTGLRRPARGLLLFGPPGNGKTMLAKAVASESEATFFNVSAASLTSKWNAHTEIGRRRRKTCANSFHGRDSKQPSVIFIDEIDSIMSTRVADENEASRRLKSEFLVQFDGVTSNSDDLVIVIGATNKPQELDDAVLRRLVKRIYVPLPDENVRRLLLKTKLKGQAYSLPGGDLERLVEETEGYSGSDLQALCEEAAMMPIRELGSNILTVKASQVRPLNYMDFEKAMKVIRPSLQKSKWEELHKWNQEFGSN